MTELATRGQELRSREKQAIARETTRPGPVFRPDVDIVERAEEYLVTADLPGVGTDGVQVRLEDGVLSIEATPGFEADPAWTPVVAEYLSGAFYREFTLSDRIDTSHITARMRDGVLELHLPKAEAHQPRRITVTS
jgi:HSP20 family molecular chaperone IbpA